MCRCFVWDMVCEKVTYSLSAAQVDDDRSKAGSSLAFVLDEGSHCAFNGPHPEPVLSSCQCIIVKGRPC